MLPLWPLSKWALSAKPPPSPGPVHLSGCHECPAPRLRWVRGRPDGGLWPAGTPGPLGTGSDRERGRSAPVRSPSLLTHERNLYYGWNCVCHWKTRCHTHTQIYQYTVYHTHIYTVLHTHTHICMYAYYACTWTCSTHTQHPIHAHTHTVHTLLPQALSLDSRGGRRIVSSDTDASHDGWRPATQHSGW